MSQELTSVLKYNDVINYKPIFSQALKQNFMNNTILTSNVGTGGPILMKVLSIINNTYNKEKYNNTYYYDNKLLLNSLKGKQFGGTITIQYNTIHDHFLKV